MELLEVKDVKYVYRNANQTVYAVNGVTCRFSEEQFYAIVGASGSGKTTLLSLLAGLDTPSEGEIRYKGVATAELDLDGYRLRDVSVIYQNFNLLQHLTVVENAAYPLYLQKRPKQEAEQEAVRQLLAVGIREDQFRRYPNMLSGGEQQRVAIARALAAGSQIILADEPTGNLDSENSEKIVAILRDLSHLQGRCVITVTHDPDVAAQADATFRMRDGRLV